MRTTIIPAQITTVEDKIAGSLNFTQILLLMAPVVAATIVYILFSPAMKLTAYKSGIVIGISALAVILALRIKEKIVAEWISVLLRFYLRPKYYLANKNDLTERLVDLPIVESTKSFQKASLKNPKKNRDEVSISELIRLEQAMSSDNLAVSFRFGGKK